MLEEHTKQAEDLFQYTRSMHLKGPVPTKLQLIYYARTQFELSLRVACEITDEMYSRHQEWLDSVGFEHPGQFFTPSSF